MKTSGNDDLHRILYKYLPLKAIVQIKHIINSMIKFQIFPTHLKHSHIIPIYKPGKPKHLPSSYRPIALLTTFSKIYEKIIQKKLLLHLHTHNLIPSSQYGFKQNTSTTHQLFHLLNNATIGFNRGQVTAMAVLDLSEAFDSVWHGGLIVKLRKFRIPTYLTNIISDFLSIAPFKLKWVTPYHKSAPYLPIYCRHSSTHPSPHWIIPICG